MSTSGMAIAAGLAIFVVAGASDSLAQVSFEGETIEWVVPSSPGGGTDTTTRILLPWFEQYLPGNPTIVVNNIPGGGTIPGINYFWENSGPNGHMLITMTTGSQTNYLFGAEAVDYVLPEFVALMGIPQGTFVYAQDDLGLSGPEDIGMLIEGEGPYLYGAQTPTSAELRVMMAWDALGVNAQPVWGLTRGESRQGFMRHEFDLMYDTAAGWLAAGSEIDHMTPLFTMGIENEAGEIVRDPVAPDLPTFLEVYESYYGEPLSGIQYEAWYSMFSTAIMNSKAVALHPSTAPEVVEAYRQAIRDMMADPEFHAAMEAELGGYDMNLGQAAQRSLVASTQISPEVCAWIDEFLNTGFDADTACDE
ncbi:MAG: hypothetical protein RLO50_21795 [Azospirillaceae bacterium]